MYPVLAWMLPSPSKCIGGPLVARRLATKGERASLEQVFGLSVLGYSRNMAVQLGSLHERRPAPFLQYSANKSLKILHAAPLRKGKGNHYSGP